jgi:hypothetical protein
MTNDETWFCHSCKRPVGSAQCTRMSSSDRAQLLTLRDVMKTAYSKGGDRLMSVWERDLNAIEAAITILEPGALTPAEIAKANDAEDAIAECEDGHAALDRAGITRTEEGQPLAIVERVGRLALVEGLTASITELRRAFWEGTDVDKDKLTAVVLRVITRSHPSTVGEPK